MFELMEDHNEEAIIKVIGVGGGGGNAVEHMVSQTIEGVEFITMRSVAAPRVKLSSLIASVDHKDPAGCRAETRRSPATTTGCTNF